MRGAAKKETETLFNGEWQKHIPELARRKYPYPLIIRALTDLQESNRFCGEEVQVFDDVIDGEAPLYWGSRTVLAGNITLSVAGKRLNLARSRKPYQLPAWVEDDYLKFERCGASGIVFVEHNQIVNELLKSREWRLLDLLLVCGFGVPRFSTRRVLNRLSTTFDLPVYILTDNDTWGYFIYSILKRGLLDPNSLASFGAIRNARYLGLRALDCSRYCSTDIIEPWESCWDIRLRFLKNYACFRKRAWQDELRLFEFQHGKVRLWHFLRSVGSAQFIRHYIQPRLREEQWLA